MRLQVVRGLFGVMMILVVCDVEAADKKKKKAKPPQAAVATAPETPPVPIKTPEELAQERLMQAWLEKLKGTTWSLELRPSSAESGGSQQDTLSFGDRRVVSEVLQQEGYGGSNFTLTAQDDQTAAWETMQAKPGGEMAFWRGEVHGDTMSGILSRQPAQGESITWSFTGKQQISQPAPPAAPTEPAAPTP